MGNSHLRQKGPQGLDWEGDHRMLNYSNRAPELLDAPLEMAQMPRDKADEDQAPFFSLFPYGSLSRRLANGRSNGGPSGGMVGWVC